MANYKYRQLAEVLKNDIVNSVYSAGQQIPIEDELIERFQVSRNTVRQAVKLLVQKGYLTKVQGSGTFVTENATAGAEKKGFNAADGRRIGVVMNQNNTYIFPRVLMGISDCLSERGYSMVIRITFNHITKEEETLAELLESDLAGLIIEPARSGLPRVNSELYKKIGETIPSVLIHAEFPEYDIPSVILDDIGGMELLVDHLVEKGHRNIAAFLKFDEYPGMERFQGYASGLRKHNIMLDEGRILWFSDEDVATTLFFEENADKVLKVIENCTAVMCYNDSIVPDFYSFLDRRGISVPNDLSVVSYDNSIEGKISPPTSIDHPKERFGRAAAEALLTLIANPTANVSRRLSPQLVERNSVSQI